MVRVISEKLFSPPRSRHSSGETVDKELAARAVEVLSGLNSRRLEFSDYESSSDSHWDSEVDVEGDGQEAGQNEECTGGLDVVEKRKERRRERNKLSAQAYRLRRRDQVMKQHTMLKELHEKNSRLKEQVHTLEEEIDKFRRTAVQRPPSLSASITPTALAPPPSNCLVSDSNGEPGLPRRDKTHPFSLPGDEAHTLDKPSTFRMVSEEKKAALPPVDNNESQRQLISPVVDNFSYSKPSVPLSDSPSNLSFSFPKSHRLFTFSGQQSKFSKPPITRPLAPISAESDEAEVDSVSDQPFKFPPPPQHTDLNANAEQRHGNINSVSAGIRFCQNDNMNDNNGNDVMALDLSGGARPKTLAGMSGQTIRMSKGLNV